MIKFKDFFEQNINRILNIIQGHIKTVLTFFFLNNRNCIWNILLSQSRGFKERKNMNSMVNELSNKKKI